MFRKILPPTYLLVAIILILILHFTLPIGMIIKIPWNLMGVLPLILGLLLNLMADRSFKLNQTMVKPFQVSDKLITDGVYRMSRHPMYLGFVLILVGISILLGSMSPYFVVFAFAIAMEVVFIRMEERMLAERFGEEWDLYRSKVRKWI
jgi:protein-S-isoprenylcysteine O-methyltransferase Ste14